MHESTFAFGPDQGLVGTVTHADSPNPTSTGDLGMILFNAGVVSRTGPHRINVKLARRLAAQGVSTIRFDLHGMGDSRRPDGRLDYRRQVVADLQAAMDALQRQAGVSTVALLGFCSGALPSYWAAQADARVRHIILYDAFDLQTRRSRLRYLALRLRRHGLASGAVMLYLRRAFGALRALPQRWRAGAAVDVEPQGDDRPSLPDLARGLGELVGRGVHVSVLHSGADFSNVNHAEQIAEAFGFARNSGVAPRTGFLASIDHIMTSVNAQTAFVDWICSDVLGERGVVAAPRAARPPTLTMSASAPTTDSAGR